MMARPDPKEVSDRMSRQRRQWLKELFPHGRERGGVFYLGDADGSPGESLPIPLKPNGQRLKDFADSWCGDDLALFARARGHGDDMRAAYLDALEFFGWDDLRDRRDKKRDKPGQQPKEANGNRSDLRAHFTGSWVYTDAAGEPWIEVCRYDPPGQRKVYNQYNLREGRWTGRDGGTLPEPRPLYNLVELLARPTERMVFVAGEKSADALMDLGVLATTNLGGEKALNKADLSPLKSRTVHIWHDNDDAGRQWRDQLAAEIRKLRGVPLVLEPPDGAAEKWDAWDAVHTDGWGLDTVEELLNSARPAATKLCCVSALDFVAMQLPPRDPIFGPWLTTQSLVMLHAYRGIGKTWCAMNIAYAAATGGRWLKWHAPKPSRVLYLDGEMPAPWFQQRWLEIMRSPQTHQLMDPLALRIVTPDLQDGAMPNIGTEEGREYIGELLPGIQLVIVDNISTLAGVGVENEAESWGPIQEWALALRKMGISVLFIHHSGKAGAQRGTSKREDVLDTVLSLRHPEGYEPDDGARFEVHFEKARGLAGPDAEPIEAWIEQNPDKSISWLWKLVIGDQREQALDLHAQGKSLREIATIVGVTKSTVERWIKKGHSSAQP